MKIVEVTFENGSRPYTYLCDFEPKPGDFVVAEVRNTFAVVQVSRIVEGNLKFIGNLRWLIQPVDGSAADDAKERFATSNDPEILALKERLNGTAR